DIHDRDAGPEVDQRVAVDVDEHAAARALDEDGQRRAQPTGAGLAAPGEQLLRAWAGDLGDDAALLGERRAAGRCRHGLLDFVDRLVGAGVSAFGLGIGLTHDRCPPELVAAADRHGLPLLEVPARTAFIAVSKAVSAALGVEEYEAITRAFEAQRDLTRGAL